MMPLKLTGILLGMIAFGTAGNHSAHGQIPDSSIADKTHRAFHGPDGTGKDGPMAALDRDLIGLYYRYRAHDASDPSASFEAAPSMPVRDSLVTIDAIAKDGSSPLLDSLEALGLQAGEQAERLVSGRLPIASLRTAAGLSGLQSMRPSQARTRTNAQSDGVRPPNSTPSSGNPDDGTNRRETEASSAKPDSVSESASRSGQKATSDPEPRSEPASAPNADSASTPESASPPAPPSVPTRNAEDEKDNGGNPSSLQNGVNREVDKTGRQSRSNWQIYGLGAGILVLGIGLVLVLRQRISP